MRGLHPANLDSDSISSLRALRFDIPNQHNPEDSRPLADASLAPGFSPVRKGADMLQYLRDSLTLRFSP